MVIQSDLFNGTHASMIVCLLINDIVDAAGTEGCLGHRRRSTGGSRDLQP